MFQHHIQHQSACFPPPVSQSNVFSWFGATSSRVLKPWSSLLAQGSLLAELEGPYMVPGNKPGLAACKARALITVPSLSCCCCILFCFFESHLGVLRGHSWHCSGDCVGAGIPESGTFKTRTWPTELFLPCPIYLLRAVLVFEEGDTQWCSGLALCSGVTLGGTQGTL